MSDLLYIEASPRKERSYSTQVARTFVETYKENHPQEEIDYLDLWSEDLPTFNGSMLDAKYAVMHGAEPSVREKESWALVRNFFNRFDQAKKYVLSVPMWNFGVPYKLKHYIDVNTQPGMAWSFSTESGYTGLCTGKAVVIYSSAGVYHTGSGAENFDLQKSTVNNWLNFVGISAIHEIIVAPTLTTPEESLNIKTKGELEARELATIF